MTKDELTGLYSRPSIIERLEAAAHDAGSLTLLYMDLDHLLTLNEKYGHVGGDAWIKSISSLFARYFGADDLVGRYGGDEFLAGVRSNDLRGLYEKAEEFRQLIEKEKPEINLSGETVHPGYTVSLGLATYPLNAGDTNDLIEKAKSALYRAKEAGGNRVYFFEEKDSLTGLLNYYGAMSALEQEMTAARQKHENLSIIMMDIDQFKQINDEYGHRAGDEVLKRLSHILSRNFREIGTIARTGGDEFMVILPSHRAESAFILAEEVRKLTEETPIRMTIGERNLNLHFQITGGVATYPSDATERVDLLRKADEALYRAKVTGRNRICLPASAQMVTKTSHYTHIQLERLSTVARKLDRSEAFLLREALDDLLHKYDDDGGG